MFGTSSSFSRQTPHPGSGPCPRAPVNSPGPPARGAVLIRLQKRLTPSRGPSPLWCPGWPQATSCRPPAPAAAHDPALRCRDAVESRLPHGGVAELADATDSKSVVRKDMWVRVPPPLPASRGPDGYHPDMLAQTAEEMVKSPQWFAGWGTLALINAGLAQGKKPQRVRVVPGLAAAWADCHADSGRVLRKGRLSFERLQSQAERREPSARLGHLLHRLAQLLERFLQRGIAHGVLTDLAQAIGHLRQLRAVLAA